ncbi:MAG: FGGY family carbohydrate kinase [Polyangiaceae bacterium]
MDARRAFVKKCIHGCARGPRHRSGHDERARHRARCAPARRGHRRRERAAQLSAPGLGDLDAREVVAATERVAAEAVRSARSLRDVAVVGMGIANQGETVVLWDRKTGEPLAPAVVWQCRRTEDACVRLRGDADLAARVRQRTGLPIDAYFSATKLAWLLDNVPGARERAARGELCAGTLDSYTVARLTGGKVFVTDPSTACRTQLADLETGRFADELCQVFQVHRDLLAEVVASDADVGDVVLGGVRAPLLALLCDQPSALLGSGCLRTGDVKCTYGTGAFLQVNAGATVPPRTTTAPALGGLGARRRAHLVAGGQRARRRGRAHLAPRRPGHARAARRDRGGAGAHAGQRRRALRARAHRARRAALGR